MMLVDSDRDDMTIQKRKKGGDIEVEAGAAIVIVNVIANVDMGDTEITRTARGDENAAETGAVIGTGEKSEGIDAIALAVQRKKVKTGVEGIGAGSEDGQDPGRENIDTVGLRPIVPCLWKSCKIYFSLRYK
jgi:hypothetical protein